MSVMGMMANVLVSFTVTALSKVPLPSPYMESHVAATAVTEEVSFTAVPAKIPKLSPLMVENPIILPSVGKSSAAKTLKKKTTEIDCAISSSLACITGAVAAMAEPPHMEDPTPTNVEILAGMLRIFCMALAIASANTIVQMMIGNDSLPVFQIIAKFMPNPSKITAYCSIFLETKRIPS